MSENNDLLEMVISETEHIINVFSKYEMTGDDNELVDWYIDREPNLSLSHIVTIEQTNEIQEEIFQENVECECVICLENYILEHFITLKCKHKFCNTCVYNLVFEYELLKCPMCREQIEL